MAEAALDNVPTLVGFLIVANARLAVGFTRNDSLDPTFLEPVAKRIGVIPFVRQQFGDPGDQAYACFGQSAVGNIARREHEYPWPAFVVDNCMDLAVSATFGEAYRLRLRPPFPPVETKTGWDSLADLPIG
jgi:hypothetical protein